MITLFAGFFLVFSRGNHFLRRNQGSINYVYFQNVAYDAFLVVNHIINLIAIKEYNTKLKKQCIVKGLLDEILGSIIT